MKPSYIQSSSSWNKVKQGKNTGLVLLCHCMNPCLLITSSKSSLIDGCRLRLHCRFHSNTFFYLTSSLRQPNFRTCTRGKYEICNLTKLSNCFSKRASRNSTRLLRWRLRSFTNQMRAFSSVHRQICLHVRNWLSTGSFNSLKAVNACILHLMISFAKMSEINGHRNWNRLLAFKFTRLTQVRHFNSKQQVWRRLTLLFRLLLNGKLCLGGGEWGKLCSKWHCASLTIFRCWTIAMRLPSQEWGKSSKNLNR